VGLTSHGSRGGAEEGPRVIEHDGEGFAAHGGPCGSAWSRRAPQRVGRRSPLGDPVCAWRSVQLGARCRLVCGGATVRLAFRWRPAPRLLAGAPDGVAPDSAPLVCWRGAGVRQLIRANLTADPQVLRVRWMAWSGRLNAAMTLRTL